MRMCLVQWRLPCPLPHGQNCRSPWAGSGSLEGLLREVHASGCSGKVHGHSALLCTVHLRIPLCHDHHPLKASAVLRSSCGQVPFDATSSEAFALPWAPTVGKVLYYRVIMRKGLVVFRSPSFGLPPWQYHKFPDTWAHKTCSTRLPEGRRISTAAPGA